MLKYKEIKDIYFYFNVLFLQTCMLNRLILMNMIGPEHIFTKDKYFNEGCIPDSAIIRSSSVISRLCAWDSAKKQHTQNKTGRLSASV